MHEPLSGKKILFTTLPADGHFNPLTGLAKYLQAVGCDVRWYTSLLYKGKLKSSASLITPFTGRWIPTGRTWMNTFRHENQ
jgi:hypothetical protein